MNSIRGCVGVGLIGALLVSSLGVAGCASARRTAGEHPTATGAVAGGLLGAAAGALIDDKSARGALIGGAIGAAAGGLVGHALQRQRERLDRIEGVQTQAVTYQLPPTEPQPGAPPQAPPQPVQREALRAVIPGELLFEQGRSDLSRAGVERLSRVAEVLREYPESRVMVRGHASSEGSDAVNVELSQRRADIVRNYLISYGVDPNRITAVGLGSSDPVADNSTESGRVRNRRVEIDIIPY